MERDVDPSRSGGPPLPFALLLACAAAYVLLSSQALPALVASHFGADGAPNGYMPRDAYLALMLVLVVGVPAVLGILPARTLRRPDARINLPHPEYWLAPVRRAQTIDFLARRMRQFALMLTLLLCVLHWEVLRANAATPPMLSSSLFSGTVTVFLLVTLGWVILLLRHFRKPRDGDRAMRRH